MLNNQIKSNRTEYDYGRSLMQIDRKLHLHIRRLAMARDIPIYKFASEVLLSGLQKLELPLPQDSAQSVENL